MADGNFKTNWIVPDDAPGNSFVATANGLFAISSAQASFTGLTTWVYAQPTDYTPGETANLFAGGFQSGESVQFQVSNLTNDYVYTPPWSVVDGSVDDLDGATDGHIQTGWLVPEDALNTTLHVSAKGELSLLTAENTFTDSVTVTPASGGTGISVANAANGPSPAFTTLGNIVIVEQNGVGNNDIAQSQSGVTLILTAPTNWTFNAGTGAVTFEASNDITSASISVTSTTITVTFSTDSIGNKRDTLTISGIQVQAATGAAASGSILRTAANPGTAMISGITNDSTNFGSLSQVNVAPTATNLSAAETYTEDSALNLTDIVVTDPDSNVTATLTLSNAAAGSLNTGTSGAVTSTYTAGTGVWTASGAVANVNALLAALTFTPSLNFDSSFNIATSISDGVAAALTGSKVITGTAVNDAPVLDAIGGQSVNEQALLSFTAAATDQDLPAQTLTFSLDAAAMALGMSITSGGAFSWTPTESQGGASYSATITVTDNGANAANLTDSETISIAVAEVNVAPVLAAIGGQSVNEQATLSFTATATDQDLPAQTLTYSLDAAAIAAGMSINPTTGAFSWTPTEAQGGASYLATITVTDNGTNASNLTDFETISIAVNEVNDAPSGTNKTVATNEDTVYTFTVADFGFSDPDDIPANALAAVKITTLSTDGVLKLSGVAVTVGQFILATNINTGYLKFYPDLNENGSPYATFTFQVQDNGGIAFGGVDLDPTPNTITINVTPVNDAPVLGPISPPPAVQYSDAIAPVTLNASDVDNAGANLSSQFSYTFNGGSVNAGLPTGLSASIASTDPGLPGQRTWTIGGTANVAPGVYVISAKVSDGSLYSTPESFTLTVTHEDARATYTGLLYVSTSSASSSTATVVLSATIRDITATADAAGDTAFGDIRKATVTFINRDTNTVIAANVPVGLVNSSDTKTGTASYSWSVNIGNADSATYTVGVIVNSYYTRNYSADNTVVTVKKPTAGSIGGGGFLVNPTTNASNGTYAGAIGAKTNFGLNVKFNKQGTNLQGNVNIIARASDGHIYQFKSNAIDSLNITSPSAGVTKATFTSKANVTDITNPLSTISLGGNKLMQVVMTDNGEPGSSDTIAITLSDSGGGLLFSSSWNGTNSIEKLLNGGNLQIRPALMLDGSAQASVNVAELTPGQLQPIVEAAKAAWLATGLPVEQVRALDHVAVQIDSLPDTELGWQNAGVITIDADAAGYGWFIDATPLDSVEFLAGAAVDPSAMSKVDLLSVVAHEIGHALGFDHDDGDDVMAETLGLGIRHVPVAANQSVTSELVTSPALPATKRGPDSSLIDAVFAGMGGATNRRILAGQPAPGRAHQFDALSVLPDVLIDNSLVSSQPFATRLSQPRTRAIDLAFTTQLDDILEFDDTLA